MIKEHFFFFPGKTGYGYLGYETRLSASVSRGNFCIVWAWAILEGDDKQGRALHVCMYVMIIKLDALAIVTMIWNKKAWIWKCSLAEGSITPLLSDFEILAKVDLLSLFLSYFDVQE